jgi:hypothetical protein
MGLCSSRIDVVPYNTVSTDLFENFKAAGIVFRSSTHILAGYQAHKKTPGVTGFGGMRKDKEMFSETAWRETLEELFEVEKVPDTLIKGILNELSTKLVSHTNGYIFIIYSFDELKTMLKLVRKSGLKSKLYDRFPRNVVELLFNRRPNVAGEVNGLCLLPLVQHEQKHPLVMKDFVLDMKEVLSMNIGWRGRKVSGG